LRRRLVSRHVQKEIDNGKAEKEEKEENPCAD
jgi:hypothetical protein